MPTVIERRSWISGALALALAPLTAQAKPRGARLLASWDSADGTCLGVLERRGDALHAIATLDLPGRAHGLFRAPDGSVLAVARRPGEWLLRWRPGAATAQWQWIETDRAFTGHAWMSRDGRTLYTPETDLDSGQGLIGVRDADSLEKQGEWPTGGPDPHALLSDANGRLYVANGGVLTRPESGRRKLAPARMDASLVRLAPDGTLDGQWRLTDPRLSIRHLAWNLEGRLGIALQAEHDDPEQRAAAPVLATFDGHALQTAEPGALAGYGGDVAPWGAGFAVSCPRAGGVALWDGEGRRAGFIALPEACALAGQEALWMGGRAQALEMRGASHPHALPRDLHLDNHWLLLG